METWTITIPEPEGQECREFAPTRSTECEGRWVRQERFAKVALTLEAKEGDSTITLREQGIPVDQLGNAYQGTGVELFRQGVIRGITDVLLHYRSLGLSIVNMTISLHGMVAHPMDSTEGTFRNAARNAFAVGLLTVGLIEKANLSHGRERET